MAWGKNNITQRADVSNYEFTIYANVGSIPASADENSIASVSATAVPAGGLMYREDIPTARDNGTALQNGDVVVMPNKGLVFRYTGTSWLSLYTKIRTNGAWQMFFDLWGVRGWAANSSFAPAVPTLTINADSITIGVSAGYSGVFRLLPQIDLTPFASVRIRASTNADSASKYALLNVVAEGVQYFDTGKTAGLVFTGSTMADRILDVSGLNGKYNLVMGEASGSGTVTVTFEEIELIL